MNEVIKNLKESYNMEKFNVGNWAFIKSTTRYTRDNLVKSASYTKESYNE